MPQRREALRLADALTLLAAKDCIDVGPDHAALIEAAALLRTVPDQEAIRAHSSQEQYPGEAKALAEALRDHANSWTSDASRWKRDNMRRAADLLEGI